MSLRHTFIANLKYYRKQKGLTQEKLAEAIGMSTSYIGDMEARERFPSPETIDKIAGALQISASSLLDERSSPVSIGDTFARNYGSDIKSELKNRLGQVIDEVCSLM